MDPRNLAEVLRHSILRNAALQDSGITTAVATQGTAKLDSAPSRDFTEAFVADSVREVAAQTSGTASTPTKKKDASKDAAATKKAVEDLVIAIMTGH
jgi:hypothetical protein